MSQVLEQRIAVDAHNCDHTQRDQGHSHNNDTDGSGHGDPHQLRIAHQQDQGTGFHRISGFHHAAQELAGVGVVRRDHIDITVFPFFHDSGLAALPPGDEHDVADRDKCHRRGIVSDLQQVIGVCIAEAGDEIMAIFLDRLPGRENVTVDQVNAVIKVHRYHLPIL